MRKPRYRIVEYLPGKYAIQFRTFLLGWMYSRDICDSVALYSTAEEAEGIIRKWLSDELHVKTVIKEYA